MLLKKKREREKISKRYFAVRKFFRHAYAEPKRRLH